MGNYFFKINFSLNMKLALALLALAAAAATETAFGADCSANGDDDCASGEVCCTMDDENDAEVEIALRRTTPPHPRSSLTPTMMPSTPTTPATRRRRSPVMRMPLPPSTL